MYIDKTIHRGHFLTSATRYISFRRECMSQSKKKLMEHMNLAIHGTLLSLKDIDILPRKISFEKSNYYCVINGTNNIATDVMFNIEYYDFLKDGIAYKDSETHEQILGNRFLDQNIKKQPKTLKLTTNKTKKRNDLRGEICVLADSEEDVVKQLRIKIIEILSPKEIGEIKNAEIEITSKVQFSKCENGIQAKCTYRASFVSFLEDTHDIEEEEDR